MLERIKVGYERFGIICESEFRRYWQSQEVEFDEELGREYLAGQGLLDAIGYIAFTARHPFIAYEGVFYGVCNNLRERKLFREKDD